MLLGGGEQPRHPLRRDEAREHALALRPRRGEQVLALREPVRAEVGPDRALVLRDELRSLRVALATERGEPVGSRRPRCGRRGGRMTGSAQTTASASNCSPDAVVTAQPAGDTSTARTSCPEPDAVSQLGGHAQRDLRAPFRDLERLPVLVVRVEARVRRNAPPCAARRAATCAPPSPRRATASRAGARARSRAARRPSVPSRRSTRRRDATHRGATTDRPGRPSRASSTKSSVTRS